jgi:hypothetical protein
MLSHACVLTVRRNCPKALEKALPLPPLLMRKVERVCDQASSQALGMQHHLWERLGLSLESTAEPFYAAMSIDHTDHTSTCAGALVARLALASLPRIAERALLLTIAAPELMPPPATLPSSAAIDKRLRAASKVAVATVAISGGYHDWQAPIAATLSQRQVQ